jgi:hypothetical protein
MCMHVRHTRGADLFTSTMPQCLHNRPVSNQLPEKEKKKKVLLRPPLLNVYSILTSSGVPYLNICPLVRSDRNSVEVRPQVITIITGPLP